MFGGRLPNYHKYADHMRPKEYIDKVRKREIFDPVLLFQLSNDFHVRKSDAQLPAQRRGVETFRLPAPVDNIYYQEPTEEYISPKTTPCGWDSCNGRCAATKRSTTSSNRSSFSSIRVSSYQSDFVLFPRVLQRPPHGPLQRRERIGSHPWSGPVHRRDTRAVHQPGHPLQHQHHHRQHAPHQRGRTCSTTSATCAVATVPTRCTKSCTSPPTR